jgi:hypothetical protein
MPNTTKHGDTRVYAFAYSRPHFGYSGLVERHAVLAAIFPRRRDGKVMPVVVQAAMVIKAYRESLRSFQAAGRLSSTLARKLGNCRPAFASVVPRSNFCDRPQLCPSCWSRRALDVWQRIDRALFPQQEDGTRLRVSDYDLVTTLRTFSPSDLAPYSNGTRVDLKAVLADRLTDRKFGLRRVIPGRKYEIRQLGPVGALDIVAVGVRKDGWQVSIRQVFVVEHGRELAIPGAKMRRIALPNRKQVAKAVARAWRYPRSLLLDGRTPPPVGALLGYLKACRGRRMWATYGVFNESKPWDKELHAAAKQRAAEKRAAKAGAANFPYVRETRANERATSCSKTWRSSPRTRWQVTRPSPFARRSASRRPRRCRLADRIASSSASRSMSSPGQRRAPPARPGDYSWRHLRGGDTSMGVDPVWDGARAVDLYDRVRDSRVGPAGQSSRQDRPPSDAGADRRNRP